MYKNKKIAVVVPAYNEEKLIGRVLSTMPDFVDEIIVVDDASQDRTSEVVKRFRENNQDQRITLLRNEENKGVGGAILTGHKFALAKGLDVVAVMAGDGQMDPAELEKILDPVVEGKADYSKGNRFINGEAWRCMPKVRFFANAGLSMLNKIASGYWGISDPQCGYTAISREALQKLDLDHIEQRYHFENSMLIHLNVLHMRVMDVPVRAIYGIGEKSGINYIKSFFSFSYFLLKSFIQRLFHKYVLLDFHPLVFFYLFGIIFLVTGGLLGLYLVIYRLLIGFVQTTSALLATMLFITGLQLTLFAMWFDKDYG